MNGRGVRLWSLLPAAVFLLISFFTSSLPASAASEFNLTTSPLPVDLVTTPGHAVSTTLRVQDSGTQAADIKIGLKKFKANGTDGTPQLLNPGPADTYINWVSFSRSSFVAQPGQWTDITMSVNPPAGAAFGYYFAVIFSNASPGTSTNTNAAQLRGAVATLVLLDVKAPGEKRSLDVVSFKSAHGLYEYLPANFSIDIRNTGNVHVIPSGNIFIQKGGKTIATLDVNPSGGNILPASDRVFKPSWGDGFPVFTPKLVNGQQVTDKHGRPIMRLSWNFAKVGHLRFGHYTAHMVLSYDNGTQDVPIEGYVSFWVVPWKMLPVVILVLVLLGIGLWTSGKSLWRRINKRRYGGAAK